MRNILLLVLGHAIIQASVMAKHYLIEAKVFDKTDKTDNGKAAPRLISKGHDYKDNGPVKFECKF